MLIKRTKHDAVFSLLVRERANWRCQKCFRYFPEGDRQGLHCSHFIGRAVRATRWHSLNGIALCFGDHQYYEQRPLEHVEFMRNLIGPEAVAELRELSNEIVRWRKPDLEEIYRHLKAEHKRIVTDRCDREFVGAEKFLTVTA